MDGLGAPYGTWIIVYLMITVDPLHPLIVHTDFGRLEDTPVTHLRGQGSIRRRDGEGGGQDMLDPVGEGSVVTRPSSGPVVNFTSKNKTSRLTPESQT